MLAKLERRSRELGAVTGYETAGKVGTASCPGLTLRAVETRFSKKNSVLKAYSLGSKNGLRIADTVNG